MRRFYHLKFLLKEKNALKKITDLLHENAVLREQYHLPQKISLQDAENALEFIRRLDPFPARSFDSGQTIYISPDVYVTKADSDDENAPRESRFKVTFAHDKLPEISLSPAFSKILAGSQSTANKNNASGFAKTHIKEAQQFLEAVQQREQTIVKAAEAIVKAQIPFFEKGPQYLLPLRMKDIAEVIDVHETTVSRIANGKYIQCEWGLFEIRYFFSNQVSLLSSALKSKEGVKHELREVLQKYDEEARQNPGEKKLTDEALVQKLQERGITIARRTVAKYRRELDIDSSFTR
jgi:RNA polymerase sigma-54 factor